MYVMAIVWRHIASAFAAMTSRKHDVMARRASSMDDHKALRNDGQTVAGADDGAMVVRSAHSSPSRGHRKFNCLRKVTKLGLIIE